jgi:hypothetical protein
VRLALGVTVLATATACGGKKVDPYERSLARGSEHVDFRGTVSGVSITGSGDFTNAPDRGRVTVHTPTGDVQQVIDGHGVYTRVGGAWHLERVDGVQTAAQMLRARIPARIVDGLVRSLEIRTGKSVVSYDFSQYGKQVSVAVPRVKGSK